MSTLLQSQNMIFISLLLLCAGAAGLLYLLIRLTSRKQFFAAYLSDARDDSPKLALFERLTALFANALSSNQTEIKNKFIAAGFYDFKYASLYMPFKYLLLVIGCTFIYWIAKVKGLQDSTLIALEASWLVLIIILPDALLAGKAKKLTHKISNQLPYLLDLMAVCVQTGMTIEAAMSYLSKEMAGFDKDLTEVLRKTNDRARIVGLASALDELYLRIPSNEMRSFVMTLKQSLQYGSSIYSVLTTLAGDIREVQMLGLEEKIGKLAAKMSIPLIVFIMVPVVILIAAPGVMRMMLHAQ